VEKRGIAREATEDNMVHAFCKLDIQGYKHKLKTCKPYAKQWLQASISVLRHT
jgi:hypothetical protein